ncbi:MAG: transglycosylase SLT domain-containing protein [Casimicrobiaceae bacterium]
MKSKSASTNSSYRSRGRILAALFLVLLLPAPGARAEIEPSQLAQFAALRSEARAYEHGEGVRRDAIRAFELYCEAARLGDADSQFSLGWMYAHGRGLPRNDSLAALFFEMAADQGHGQARTMLRLVGEAAADQPECMREPPGPDPEEDYLAAFAPKEAEQKDEKLIATTPQEQIVFDLVHKLAPDFQVSPRLAVAVIRAESNFDPKARSPKNAQGLMQLIPETSARFNVKKPLDPIQNIRGGLAYLRWLLAYFRGDVALVAAVGNAGDGAVNRYRGVPPYAETRAYVKQIMRLFKNPHHPFDASVTEPSPEMARIRMVKVQ